MSTLRVNTIQDTAGSGSPAINGLARAWVNFNGTGTVAIRAASNVSSITDNGTGDYTVNFTTAIADENYNAVFGVRGNASPGRGSEQQTSPIKTTTQLRIGTQDGNTVTDVPIVSVTIFR